MYEFIHLIPETNVDGVRQNPEGSRIASGKGGVGLGCGSAAIRGLAFDPPPRIQNHPCEVPPACLSATKQGAQPGQDWLGGEVEAASKAPVSSHSPPRFCSLMRTSPPRPCEGT